MNGQEPTPEAIEAARVAYEQMVDRERVAQLIAHRACCGTEHDPPNGKLHGYCVVCGVEWPCEYAGKPPVTVADVCAAMDRIPLSERKPPAPSDWLTDALANRELVGPAAHFAGSEEVIQTRVLRSLMKQANRT
jgi:hypothetical protein